MTPKPTLLWVPGTELLSRAAEVIGGALRPDFSLGREQPVEFEKGEGGNLRTDVSKQRLVVRFGCRQPFSEQSWRFSKLLARES